MGLFEGMFAVVGDDFWPPRLGGPNGFSEGGCGLLVAEALASDEIPGDGVR